MIKRHEGCLKVKGTVLTNIIEKFCYSSDVERLEKACENLAPWVSASMTVDKEAKHNPCKEYLDACEEFLAALHQDMED